MQTIVLDQPGRLSLTETPPPAGPGPGEAIVRVHRIGVCGTDLHAFKGEQPFFSYPGSLGHELGVEVLAIGSGGDPTGRIVVGDRCAVEPYLNCGTCVACRRGKTNCCVALQTLGVHTDGGMREAIALPLGKLHPAPTLSYEQLALVEMLGIGAHAVSRAAIEPGEWALVVGAGPIGLSTMVFAKDAGARVIATDLDAGRLAFCRRELGIEHTLQAGPGLLEELRALTDGELPTVVFDATGSARSMMGSFNLVAHGGRLVFVGLVQADITFNDPEFHRREITLLASRNATAGDITRIIAAIEGGRIATTSWISQLATPEEAVERFGDWTRPKTGVIKAMVRLS
jgi:threonine dehydrogenase-like Zn-dependent dehydrogenase